MLIFWSILAAKYKQSGKQELYISLKALYQGYLTRAILSIKGAIVTIFEAGGDFKLWFYDYVSVIYRAIIA